MCKERRLRPNGAHIETLKFLKSSENALKNVLNPQSPRTRTRKNVLRLRHLNNTGGSGGISPANTGKWEKQVLSICVLKSLILCR